MRCTTRVDDAMTGEKRLQEVARILAGGIVRLRTRAALPGADGTDGRIEKSPENQPNCLEVSGETRLSVHRG